MQLRSKKAEEIKGFLRRPQTLQPKFNLDTNVEEYIKKYRKYKYYTELYWSFYASPNQYSINQDIQSRVPNRYLTLLDTYKNSNNVVDNNKFKIVNIYNKLKNSEMYDESVCKMHVVEIAKKYYLGIHFPKLFLSVVNSDSKPVELRDIYFYLKDSNLGVFRTTLDVNNPKFVHPHVNANFGNYCLGNSPLSTSLINLNYHLDTFNEDDVDIFWVNFYRTITQKTEHGDHYYALSRLNEALDITWEDFLNKVMNNEEFINSFSKYLSVHTFTEEILLVIDKSSIKKDFFELFSYESSSIPDKKDILECAVKIDDVLIKNKKFTSIYKNPRKLYNNVNTLLDDLLKAICPNSIIDKTYDDYKEEIKQSNNSGEQSVRQDQVFEFQML